MIRLSKLIKPSGALSYILLAAIIVASSSAATTVIVQQVGAQTVPSIPVDRDVEIYFKTFCISVIIVTWCF